MKSFICKFLLVSALVFSFSVSTVTVHHSGTGVETDHKIANDLDSQKRT